MSNAGTTSEGQSAKYHTFILPIKHTVRTHIFYRARPCIIGCTDHDSECKKIMHFDPRTSATCSSAVVVYKSHKNLVI